MKEQTYYLTVSHFPEILLAQGQPAIGSVKFSWKSEFSLQNLIF